MAIRMFSLAKYGKLDELKEEVKKDPSALNQTDEHKQSLLHIACYAKKYETAEYLIEQGMDVNQGDKRQETPMMNAAIKNDIKLMELLLKNGAKIDLKNIDGQTAFIIAVHEKNKEAITFLLENGADPNIVVGEKENLATIVERTRAYELIETILHFEERIETEIVKKLKSLRMEKIF
jgi:ankyrin repeat protein